MNSAKNQMVPVMLEMQTAQMTPVNGTTNNAQLRVGKADINNIYLDILNIHDSIVNHLETIVIHVYNMVEKSLRCSSREDCCRELHTGGDPLLSGSSDGCINVTNDEQSESAGGGVVSSSNGTMHTEGKQPCTHVDRNSHVKIEPAEGNSSGRSEHANVGHGRMPNNEMDRLVNSSEKGMTNRTQEERTNNSVNKYMHGEYHEREENIPSINTGKELKCSNELAKMKSNYDEPVEVVINKMEPEATKCEKFYGENTHKGDNPDVEEVIKENKLNLRKNIILLELLKYVMVHSNNSQGHFYRDKIVNPQMGGNNDMHKLRGNFDFLKMNLNSDESICCDQNFCNVNFSSVNIKYLNIISYYMDFLSPFNKFHKEKPMGEKKLAQRCVDGDVDGRVDGDADGQLEERAQLTLVRKKLDDIALNYDDLVEDILKNNNVNGFTESYLYALKDRILQGEFPLPGATGMHGGDAERPSRILLSGLKRQPGGLVTHGMSRPNGDVHSGSYVGGTSIGSGTVLARHVPYSHFAHAIERVSERPNGDFLRSVNPFPGGNAQEGEVPNWGPANGTMTSIASVAHTPRGNNPFGKKAVHHNSFVPKGYTFTNGRGPFHKGRKKNGDEGRNGEESLNAYDNIMCESTQSYHHLYNNNDIGGTFNHVSSTDMNYAHAIGGPPAAGIKHLVKQISKEHAKNSKNPIRDDTVMNYDHYSATTMYGQESNLILEDKYNQNGNDHYEQYYKGGYAGGREGLTSYPGNFKNGIKMESKKEHFLERSEIVTYTGHNYSNDTNNGNAWGNHHVGTLHAQGRDHYDANDPRRLPPRRIIPNEGESQDGGFAPPSERNIKNGTKLKCVDGVEAWQRDAEGREHLGEAKNGEKEEDNVHNLENSNNTHHSHHSNHSHPSHAQSGNREARRHHGGDSRRDAEKTHSTVRSNKYDSSYNTNDKHFFSATPSFNRGANWDRIPSPNDDGAYAHGLNTKSGNHHSGGALKRTMFDGRFNMHMKGAEQMDNAFLNRGDKDSSMGKMPTSSLVELHHKNGEDILGTQFYHYLSRSNSLNSYNRPSRFSFYVHSLRDGLPTWDAQNHSSCSNGGTNYASAKNSQSNDESNGRHNNDTDGRGSNNSGGYSQSGGAGNNGISRSNDSGSNDNDGDDDKNGEHRNRGKKDYYDEKEDEEDENENQNDGRGKDQCADHANKDILQDGGEKRTSNQFNMNPDVCEGAQHNEANQSNSQNLVDDPNAHSRRNERMESFLENHQMMESSINEAKYEGHGNSSGGPNRAGVSQRIGVAGGAINVDTVSSQPNRSNRANRTSQHRKPSQPNQPNQPSLLDSPLLANSCNFIPFGGQVSFPHPANYGHYGGFDNFGNYGGYSNIGDRNYGGYSNCGNFFSSYSNGRDDREVARSALTHSIAETSEGRSRVLPRDEVRIRTGAGSPMGTNNQVKFHNQENNWMSNGMNSRANNPINNPMSNEMYAPHTDADKNGGERNRPNCKPSMVNMAEKNESMEHDLINFTNSAYVDIHKIIQNDDLLKNELSGLEESLQVANAATKGSKKNASKYNSNELEILMMYDSCKNMLKSCSMLRSEELKNADGDEYLVNETCIPPNVLTNNDMMSDSLNADIEKIIDIMSTNMQAKGKDKKRKLSSMSSPPNDRTFPNGEKKPEYMGEKSNSKKMPRNSEDKRKKYQKMDIRTLNKNVQKNKEVCKNCYIHYDNSKSSYILTFINRKQKKQRKLFPVNPNEKDEAYVIQIMNYIEKLKDQEKIFGISKNDEMGGEEANVYRSEGGKTDADRRNYDKDQPVQEKHMASERYAGGNVPKKNEMCSNNLNLLNEKMNNFLSGINDQLYMDPQMNFIPDHLPFIQNVGANPNVSHVNIYDDVNAPSGVDYMNFNLVNDGNSFENMHLMNPCTNSVQNVNPFFKLHSKKGDFSTRMNGQYVGDIVGNAMDNIVGGEVNTGGQNVHVGVATDMNNNSANCSNVGSGMNSLGGRRGNKLACNLSGGSHNRSSNKRSSHSRSSHNRGNRNPNSQNPGNHSGNTPFAPNVYENTMMQQVMKNVIYPGDNNQAMNHQKGPSSGNPTNSNDQFSPMNMFTNANFSNYNQSNMPNSCENEMMHNYNSVMNDYGSSMLVESNYDSNRATAGGHTMQHE
ncbi:hypothetical protein C922_01864 [Plasmodium inui San Antonio 1]|uniref:Uncharacterized protein n=1 Tax=Plasmodium inui San Antonio 1 TaxID=1237626 RepID=W7AF69_9APIC|nr:hypothetical protein C922_01864 [Plasmodium inui San Antonio 1]EUD67679.1 hypothetical protein C922_01864 [Plasmodium inui San Antonio 1]